MATSKKALSTCRLIIRNLPFTVRVSCANRRGACVLNNCAMLEQAAEGDLLKEFGEFGPVHEVHVPRKGARATCCHGTISHGGAAARVVHVAPLAPNATPVMLLQRAASRAEGLASCNSCSGRMLLPQCLPATASRA